MDKTDSDKLVELMIRSYEGRCTLSEAKYLFEQLATDAFARQLWKDVNDVYAMDIKALLPKHASPRKRFIRWACTLFKAAGHYVTRDFCMITLSAILIFLPVSIQNEKSNSPGIPDEHVNGPADISCIPATIVSTAPIVTYYFSGGVRWAQYTVQKAHSSRIELQNETCIYLIGGSTLRIPQRSSGIEMEVHLEGEAYFEIMQEADRPFAVHSNAGSVTLYAGHVFVETYDNHLTTWLLAGSASISTQYNNVALQPGQTALTGSKSRLVRISNFDRDMILSRLKGKYLFASRPLGEICKVLERLYDIPPIAFDQPEIAHTRYTGVIFRKEPIYTFLDMLKDNRRLTYYPDEKGRIHLKYALKDTR